MSTIAVRAQHDCTLCRNTQEVILSTTDADKEFGLITIEGLHMHVAHGDLNLQAVPLGPFHIWLQEPLTVLAEALQAYIPKEGRSQ